MQDLHNNIKPSVALDVAAISSDTTTVGNTIDTADYGSLEFVVVAGTLTDGSYAVQLFEGDESDMSDESQVTDTDDLLGSAITIALTEDDTVERIGYRGNKRYVRLKVVSTSTTSGGTLGAVAIQGHPRTAPVA